MYLPSAFQGYLSRAFLSVPLNIDSVYPGASAQFLDLPSCGSVNPPSGPQVQTLVFHWLI